MIRILKDIFCAAFACTVYAVVCLLLHYILVYYNCLIMKFDPKVETILEELILKAWESGIDLHVEPAFNDARGYNSCIVCI